MDGHVISVRLLNGAAAQNHGHDTGLWHQVAAAGVVVCPRSPELRWTAASLAGERLAAGCDDDRFFSDFSAVFGGEAQSSEAPAGASVVVQIFTKTTVDGIGLAHVARGGVPVAAGQYMIGLDRPDCPYEGSSAANGWSALRDKESGQIAIMFRGHDVLFLLSETWTIAALSLIFRAVFGIHSEAILFHASSVSIGANGIMLAGPRRAGKSTMALALAARGHQFLGDEIAWYLPQSHELIDFRRPVGVRGGLRARAVDEAMASLGSVQEPWHDSVRLPIDALIRQEAARRVRLSAVFLLRGFEARARAVPVTPTLDHVPLLQPILVSLLNIPPGRRVLQMVRLLSSVQMYDLYLGHPDETAQLLEEVSK